ncbi:NLRP3 protein, partial [Polypterus senegalus]|nr:NLRP3 protein [Polypterus senegalus]
MELEAKGKTHTHLMEKHRDSSINIEHLFSAIENERKEPKTVVIQGPSGIGKSFTVHKIMLDWASGKLFPDRFRYVFHLCCRELRIWENNSLEDLIMQCSDTLKPAIQEIQSDPKSVLFIFDGFDELKLFPEDGESKDGKNVATSVVIKLLRKNILREASLLITTRPTALHVLEKIVTIERCVEVVGFLEEEIKDYFIKSFQNEKEAISAFNIIEENKVVLSMCFVPIFCWIVCSIMKTGGQNSEQIMKNMQTDSQVMLHFINHLLEHHCMSSTSGKTEFLQKVNKLAFFGIREEKRVFTEKDLSMCSINTDNNETTFFSKLFFKADARRHVLYHFLHLTVQELFAAIYCVSRSSNEEIEQLLNDSLDTKNQSLIHVVRFIFGLSSVKSQEIMEDGCQIMSNNLRIHLHNWFPKAVMSFRDNPPFLLQLLYCLYEIQDAQFAAYAMTVLSQLNFRRYTLNIIDCTVIKYCIEHTDSLEQLDLCCCNLEEKEIKILWKVIFKSQDIRQTHGPVQPSRNDHLSTTARYYSKQYKEEIKDNLVKIREYNSLPGETVDFNARYTKLILVKKNQQVEEKKMELEAKGKTHTHLMEKHRDSSINIEHLFSAIENERKEPKTVVIQGPSGIGKSFTVHKIMLDWASGKLFPDRFRYVFHLCCRELRIWENNSLEDLIMQCSDTLKPAIQEIQSDPKSVLFIFDGFDELKLFPEDGESKDGKNVATSVVIKLLRKNILREASLLITTRPTALHVLEKIVTIERCVEVVGFLEEEIKDYFIKSFQNEKEAISAFNIIEENKVVLSMCFVPIFCWIVCSIMKTGGQNSEQIMKNMQTDSQVMLHFINHLLEHHCMSSTSGKTEFLQKVNKLAFFGIREEKRVFTEKDLSMCSINTDNNETTFFSKLFFKADARRHVLYHFLHLTVQELFAAIYCVSRSSNEEIEQLLNDSLDTKNQSLIHVVRFIFGLSSVKSQEIMEDGCQIMSNNLRIHLHNWFPKAVMSFRDNPPFLLQLLYCLYEIQDAQFAAYAMTVLSQLNFRRYTLNIIDCTVIKYCIEHTDSLEQLDLCCCNLEEKEIKILWKVIFKSQDIR